MKPCSLNALLSRVCDSLVVSKLHCILLNIERERAREGGRESGQREGAERGSRAEREGDQRERRRPGKERGVREKTK